MGNTAGKLSEKATRNPPGRTPEISYGRAILQPVIYNLSTDARRGPEKQPETSGNIPRGLHGENHREADRQIHPKPAGDHREDAGKTFGNTAGKTLLRVASRPCEGKACAHIPICQRTSLSISSIHLSASHHAPPKHPRHPAHGAWVRRIRANGTGWRRCRPLLVGWGVRLHGAKAPRLPKRRRRQAPARGLAAVNSHHHPIRNEKKHPSPLLLGLGCVNPAPTACGTAAPLLVGWGCVCMEPKHPVSQNAAGGKPLLVGLPPSTPTTTPFGTKRRTPAPCSWGGRSSTSSQRHWQAALRPAGRRCGRDRRSVPFQSRSRRPDPARG